MDPQQLSMDGGNIPPTHQAPPQPPPVPPNNAQAATAQITHAQPGMPQPRGTTTLCLWTRNPATGHLTLHQQLVAQNAHLQSSGQQLLYLDPTHNRQAMNLATTMAVMHQYSPPAQSMNHQTSGQSSTIQQQRTVQQPIMQHPLAQQVAAQHPQTIRQPGVPTQQQTSRQQPGMLPPSSHKRATHQRQLPQIASPVPQQRTTPPSPAMTPPVSMQGTVSRRQPNLGQSATPQQQPKRHPQYQSPSPVLSFASQQQHLMAAIHGQNADPAFIRQLQLHQLAQQEHAAAQAAARREQQRMAAQQQQQQYTQEQLQLQQQHQMQAAFQAEQRRAAQHLTPTMTRPVTQQVHQQSLPQKKQRGEVIVKTPEAVTNGAGQTPVGRTPPLGLHLLPAQIVTQPVGKQAKRRIVEGVLDNGVYQPFGVVTPAQPVGTEHKRRRRNEEDGASQSAQPVQPPVVPLPPTISLLADGNQQQTQGTSQMRGTGEVTGPNHAIPSPPGIRLHPLTQQHLPPHRLRPIPGIPAAAKLYHKLFPSLPTASPGTGFGLNQMTPPLHHAAPTVQVPALSATPSPVSSETPSPVLPSVSRTFPPAIDPIASSNVLRRVETPNDSSQGVKAGNPKENAVGSLRGKARDTSEAAEQEGRVSGLEVERMEEEEGPIIKFKSDVLEAGNVADRVEEKLTTKLMGEEDEENEQAIQEAVDTPIEDREEVIEEAVNSDMDECKDEEKQESLGEQKGDDVDARSEHPGQIDDDLDLREEVMEETTMGEARKEDEQEPQELQQPQEAIDTRVKDSGAIESSGACEGDETEGGEEKEKETPMGEEIEEDKQALQDGVEAHEGSEASGKDHPMGDAGEKDEEEPQEASYARLETNEAIEEEEEERRVEEKKDNEDKDAEKDDEVKRNDDALKEARDAIGSVRGENADDEEEMEDEGREEEEHSEEREGEEEDDEGSESGEEADFEELLDEFQPLIFGDEEEVKNKETREDNGAREEDVENAQRDEEDILFVPVNTPVQDGEAQDAAAQNVDASDVSDERLLASSRPQRLARYKLNREAPIVGDLVEQTFNQYPEMALNTQILIGDFAESLGKTMGQLMSENKALWAELDVINLCPADEEECANRMTNRDDPENRKLYRLQAFFKKTSGKGDLKAVERFIVEVNAPSPSAAVTHLWNSGRRHPLLFFLSSDPSTLYVYLCSRAIPVQGGLRHAVLSFVAACYLFDLKIGPHAGDLGVLFYRASDAKVGSVMEVGLKIPEVVWEALRILCGLKKKR